MRVHDLTSHIQRYAPALFAAAWDRCGIQVAARTEEISALAVTLDPSPRAVQTAIDHGCQMLLTHHPLTLHPDLPARTDTMWEVLRLALGANLWIFSAHTNLDANPQGPASWLARALSLQDVSVLQETGRQTPTLLVLEAPASIPLPPTIEPAWHTAEGVAVWPEDLPQARTWAATQGRWLEMPTHGPYRQMGFGQIGNLPHPMTWAQCRHLLESLGLCCNRRIGQEPEVVHRIAMCPGSGASLGPQAFAQGAQVFITGDIKYHDAQTLAPLGLSLDVGHFILEEIMMRTWSETLREELSPHGVYVHFVPGHDPFWAA
jgi:dinuclear metal center YbgI/SA1388 family protein